LISHLIDEAFGALGKFQGKPKEARTKRNISLSAVQENYPEEYWRPFDGLKRRDRIGRSKVFQGLAGLPDEMLGVLPFHSLDFDFYK
jgi:hypothetical protein